MAYLAEQVFYDRQPFADGGGEITPDNFDPSANPPALRWARLRTLSPAPSIVGDFFQIKRTGASGFAYYYRQTSNFDPKTTLISGPGTPGFANEVTFEVKMQLAEPLSSGDTPNKVTPFKLWMGDAAYLFVLGIIRQDASSNNFSVGLLKCISGVFNEEDPSFYETGATFTLQAGKLYRLELKRNSDGSGSATIYQDSDGAVLSQVNNLTRTDLPPVIGNYVLPGSDGNFGPTGLGITETTGPQTQAGFYAFGVPELGGGTYDVDSASYTLQDHDSSNAAIPDAARSIDFLARDTIDDDGIAPPTGKLYRSPDIFVVDLKASGFTDTGSWEPPQGSQLQVPGGGSLCDYTGLTFDVSNPTGNQPSTLVMGNRIEREVPNYAYVRVRNIGQFAEIKDAFDSRTFFGQGQVGMYLCQSTTLNDPALWVNNRWVPVYPDGDVINKPDGSGGFINQLAPMPFTEATPACATLMIGPFRLAWEPTLKAALALGGHPCMIAVVNGIMTTIHFDVDEEFGFCDPEPPQLYASGAGSITFKNMVSQNNSIAWRNLRVLNNFS